MKYVLRVAVLAAAAVVGLATSPGAQEPPVLPPAFQGGSAEEKVRLTELIAAAKKEGSLTYWDVVIQPETNDALAAAFRKFYGLPNGFQIHYQLSATAPLVTRVEQEINASRVTIDVAAVGSPSWVFERAAAGDALEYDSPQYKFYADVMARGLGRKRVFAFNGAYLFVPMWSTTGPNLKANPGKTPSTLCQPAVSASATCRSRWRIWPPMRVSARSST